MDSEVVIFSESVTMKNAFIWVYRYWYNYLFDDKRQTENVILLDLSNFKPEMHLLSISLYVFTK